MCVYSDIILVCVKRKKKLPQQIDLGLSIISRTNCTVALRSSGKKKTDLALISMVIIVITCGAPVIKNITLFHGTAREH